MTATNTKRPRVRVALDGETSWGEHVTGNVYRSLNTTMSDLPLRLPDDHPDSHLNTHLTGARYHFKWGHLFTANVVRDGVVSPIEIIGIEK